MLRRNYLGLEINAEGLRAISVDRRGSSVGLRGGQTLRFSEGVLLPTVLEPNIRKPELFVDAIRDVLLPLTNREKRLAVALPNSAGHLYLLDINTPFKNHAEGLDIVRWQLKDLLPPQLVNYTADYQVIAERESGGRRVLASVMAKDVLTQYEELLQQAGFSAALIDFHIMNLYNAYQSRIELGTDFFLLSVTGNQLGLLAFANHQLDLCRTKSVPTDPERIFQEINRSLVAYRRLHGSMARTIVHLYTDWQQPDELLEAVKSSFEVDIQLLPAPLQSLINADQLQLPAADARGMAAALGAAERLIKRMN